ncbi:MAG TPA: hypothetical protein VK797_19090 [Tepidisphaeraceae bacterium]|jgi:hypothetical protein|nr:hypothetical protein [Tepidisphaeraceae bacterium]
MRGRTRRCFWLAGVAFAAAMSLSPGANAQITFGQIDDFQLNPVGDSVLGWTRGVNAPQYPFVVATGGPQGADGFLEVPTTGTTGSGARINFFNQSQWTGNYVAAGVTQITAEIADFGATPLYMRIAFQDAFGTEYGSTNYDFVPADGQWHPVSFDLTPAGLTLLQGGETAEQALTTVGILRVLSNAEMPSYRGDVIPNVMGMDEVAAVPEPAPPTFVGAVAAVLLCRRRRVARNFK